MLHLTLSARGGATLTAGDFGPAFFAVAVIAGLSTLAFWWLPVDAGAEMSGRRLPTQAQAATQTTLASPPPGRVRRAPA
jgi:hypothetical protein